MMHDEEAHSNSLPIHLNGADGDVDASDQPSISLAPISRSRRAMILVCLLLTTGAILSLGCFVCQFYYRWEYGERPHGMPLRWAAVIGHLVRGAGLSLLCFRLAQYVRSIEPNADEPTTIFATRHQVFWKTFACVFLIVTAYAIFQVTYTSWQDRNEAGFGFPPQFQSGRVEFRKGRIEIRRGFSAPMPGLQKMQKKDSEEVLFVAADAEITGRDIADAKIEIAEVFPGQQSVSLTIKFTDEGTRKMEKLTKEHQNQTLAVLIDGELRATPRVFAIISRDAFLSGVLTLDEAARIIENGDR